MRRRLYGVALGLVATLAGLAAGGLVAGLFRSAAEPVLPVGQVVIDHVTPGIKDWAIDTFGTADKAVLIAGTVFVLAVIGSLVGLLMASGRRAAACLVTAGVGLVGVLAVFERPEPSLVKLLPALAGTVVSLAVLVWPGHDWAADTNTGTDTADADPAIDPDGRRQLLVRLSSVGVLALAGGALGRLLRNRFDVDAERAELELPPVEPAPAASVPTSSLPTVVSPAGLPGEVPGPTEFGLAGITPFVVPSADFYRIDTALAVPQVPRADWRLRIHGMVDQELELTFDDVLARPQVERQVTLSCVSNWVGGPLVGNAVWQGVLLAPLLAECGVHPDATQVVSRSVDGWTAGSPTSVITDGRDALLAIGMNGEPLPAAHGYPARLVVPGLYGYVSATKWVTEIELVRWEDFDAYWVPRGWAKEAPVKTMARIDRAVDGYLAGVAWAVHRGVSRVEVRIDEGEWMECELAGVPSDDTWRQWRLPLDPALPNGFRAQARAYDGGGQVQPPGPKAEAPDGAEGYHTRTMERA